MVAQKTEPEENHRNLKYLITGIDDMRDVISMIWGMINSNIERDERVNMARSIIPGSIPLTQGKSSFILNLQVPESLMENKDG
jgi:hypothetical protein